MFYLTVVVFSIFFLFQCLYVIIPIVKVNKINKRFLFLQKPISIIVPAYNEQDVILSCLLSLMALNYREFEVIIINDGSTDDTLSRLRNNLGLCPIQRVGQSLLTYNTVKNVYKSSIYPNISVVDKENGGKADSLNAGIDFAEHHIVVTIDADCILHADSLQYINFSFSNPDVVAAGCTVQVANLLNNNDKKQLYTFRGKGLVKHQIIDYLNAFYIRRYTQQFMSSIGVISGAFGVFKRSVLIDVGGYQRTIGEDMDITLKIQRYIQATMRRGQMICIPEAIAFTEVPDDIRNYLRQRIRWQKAFIDCLLYYRKVFLKRQFSLSFLTFLLGEALGLGIVNVFSVLLLPIYFTYGSDFRLVFYFFLLSFYALMFQNLISLWISHLYNLTFRKKDYIKIILFIPFEIMTYRLLNIVIFVYGSIAYFFNKNWNKVKRFGTISNNLNYNQNKPKGSVKYHDSIEDHFYYRIFLSDRPDDNPPNPSHIIREKANDP